MYLSYLRSAINGAQKTITYRTMCNVKPLRHTVAENGEHERTRLHNRDLNRSIDKLGDWHMFAWSANISPRSECCGTMVRVYLIPSRYTCWVLFIINTYILKLKIYWTKLENCDFLIRSDIGTATLINCHIDLFATTNQSVTHEIQKVTNDRTFNKTH